MIPRFLSVRRAAGAVARSVLGLALLAAAPAWAGAQRVDSARVAPARPPVPDSGVRPVATPPLTPRRAFLYSLLLPGYSQSVLGRTTAGAIFVLSESIAI
ncbi:MAG TPA: hypothetical protein VFN38_16780, partial [Gemmatimonadaceae bacterium]|nr:hypothetical protein [Gemmatimonadaceae bacterium]